MSETSTNRVPDPEGVWLGIDLGTQSARVVAVTGDGREVGRGEAALTSRRDGVRHEQDPETWWHAVCTAAGAAMREVDRGAVRGLAVDGTSGTLLLLDRDGVPLSPGLMYDDTRAVSQVERVNEVGGDLWQALGYQRMQPAWALPKLLWLLAEHRDLPAGARLAHQVDLVNRRLAGTEVATDLSNALKTGVDLVAEEWPREVMDALGVPADLLPAVVRSGTVIGTVCAAAATATGIPEGVPIVAGATDGCAAQLGAGALEVGGWNSVIGTTLVLKGVTADLVRDPLGVVYSHRGPDGSWLPGGASSTGAGAISRDFPGADLDDLNRLASAHEPSGAVCYPLVSAGERFPFVAPDARGFTLGTPADDGDRFAAVLQGISFLERLCFDYLDLLGAPLDGDLLATGGATRSAYWVQLRADVLGRQVTLPAQADSGRGMAVLAASPGRRPADVAAAMVRIDRRVDPRPGVGDRFVEPYLRLVGELESRGWLPAEAAAHARASAGTGG